jgi:hypothetical protein
LAANKLINIAQITMASILVVLLYPSPPKLKTPTAMRKSIDKNIMDKIIGFNKYPL